MGSIKCHSSEYFGLEGQWNGLEVWRWVSPLVTLSSSYPEKPIKKGIFLLRLHGIFRIL